MGKRRHAKLIHEGSYVAEVDVELIYLWEAKGAAMAPFVFGVVAGYSST